MKVSFDVLEDAFMSAGEEAYYWLDKRTGKVIFCDEEIRQSVINGEEDDLTGWQKEIADEARPVLAATGEIENAGEIDRSDGARYLVIEPPNSDESRRGLADFAGTVEDKDLRDKLIFALRGGKPFRRFKNVLADYPEQGEKWFQYESRRLREHIENWAGVAGIEIDFEN